MPKVSVAIEQTLLDKVFATLPANENAESAALEALEAWVFEHEERAENVRRIEAFQQSRLGVPGDEVLEWLSSTTTDTPMARPKSRYLPKS